MMFYFNGKNRDSGHKLCHNNILCIKNLIHIWIYFTIFEREGKWLASLLEEGERSEKISRRGRKKAEARHILSLFWRGELNFYDPKIKIWKINYCKSKVKSNNKDNSKNNDNEIKETIYSKYIFFICIFI